MTFPASTNWRVTATSSRLGSGLPEGWLWAKSTAAAFASTAALNTCLGSTIDAASPPTLATCKPVSVLAVFMWDRFRPSPEAPAAGSAA